MKDKLAIYDTDAAKVLSIKQLTAIADRQESEAESISRQ